MDISKIDLGKNGIVSFKDATARQLINSLESSKASNELVQTLVDNILSSIPNRTSQLINDGNGASNFATLQYVINSIAAIPTPDVSGQIATHNQNNNAHQDIRLLLNTKQSIIDDLNTIRNGARAGATAVQPSAIGALASLNDIDYGSNYITNKPNLSNFITNTVNSLTNYYLKSETYTQTEVNTLIAAIKTIKVEIVQELPSATAELYFNSSKTIYMVANNSQSNNNYYDEYITIRNGVEGSYTYSWEHIGNTQIDLSGYVQKTFTIANIDLQDNISKNELQEALDIMTTNTTQIISGAKTFSSLVDVKAGTSVWDISCGIKYGSTEYIAANNNGEIGVQASSAIYNRINGVTKTKLTSSEFKPSTTNSLSLGSSSFLWKDLYLSGNLSDGTNSVKIEKIATTDTVQAISSRVTSLSNSSTDTEYPSAKCVYDFVNNAKKLYYCTYETTTYEEITQALSDGKLPVCVYSDRLYVYAFKTTTLYVFNCQYYDTLYSLRVKTNETWEALSYGFEIRSNKTQTITSSSTTGQYPSAKAVYDFIENSKELYVCTYGTTTYAEITTALSAGKVPVCFYDNKQYVYVGLSSTNRYTFASQLFDTQRYISVNSSDSWGAGNNNFEVTANKVKSISSSSTDGQYPSAKCVYDALANKQDNSLTGSSDPTTSTQGKLGQIYINTSTQDAFICTSTGATYTWKQVTL